MDETSLDFLDDLVPGTDRDAAPSQRQGKRKGRSLPPPPASLLAGSQEPRNEIEIDVDLAPSEPAHAVPAPASDPASKSDASAFIPMPEGKSRSGHPPARAASGRPAPPPPPPSLRPAAPSTAPAALPMPVTSRPPPPPSLRASAPELAEPARVEAAWHTATSSDTAPSSDAAPLLPDTDVLTDGADTAAREQPAFSAVPEDDDEDGSDALPTGVVHAVPDTPGAAEPRPITVSPDVWGVDSVSSATGMATRATVPPTRALLGTGAYAPGSSAPPPPPPVTAGARSLPPPPPPPTSSLPPPPQIPLDPARATDWDEAPTNVYQRDSLRSTAPRAASVTLPPMPTVPSARAPSRATLSTHWAQQNLKWLAAAGAAVVVLAVILFFPRGPATGELVINVAGPGGVPVDGMRIYLDDELVCNDSPCQLSRVEAAGHFVTAEAEGYNKTAALAVLVNRGKTTLQNVELVRARTGTGIAVPDSPGDVELFVDGKRIGLLPQRLDDLSPGEHVLRFSAGKSFETSERTVTLKEGEILALEPVRLRVLQGIAKLRAGKNADGAEIEIEGRPVKLPANIELDGTKTHRLVATREGFRRTELALAFDPGEAERTWNVALEPESPAAEAPPTAEATVVASETSSSATTNTSASRTTARSSSAAAVPTPAPAAKKTTKAAEAGKLTLLSVPPVVVILNGKPIGMTPKRAIPVSAGDHNIVFVHPEKGRKRASATVAPGGSKTVAVRF